METLTLKNGESDISCSLFVPPVWSATGTGCLVIHGWQSGQDRRWYLAEALLEKGIASMTFDLRGHGASGGDIEKLSRKDFLDDVLVAYDRFVTRIGAHAKIIGIGSSFGGYLLTLLSKHRAMDGMILRAPANYRDEHFTESFVDTRHVDDAETWKKSAHHWSETESLQAVHDFSNDILIVESELDELVPQSVLESYANAVLDTQKLSYKIMKGAPHSLTKFPEFQVVYKNIVLAWLKA